MPISRRFQCILSFHTTPWSGHFPFAIVISTNARPATHFAWVCLLIQLFSLQCSAHMTGVSYADVEIQKQSIGVWLQINLRELKFAQQFDRNSDLLITEQEIQEGYRQFEPHLLEQFRIFGTGEEGQGRLVEVKFDPQRGELRCHLVYAFVRPLDDVVFKVTLHFLTDSGHWDLAQIRYDGLEEQRYFNLETPEARVELRRGVQSYLRLAARSAAYALKEFFATTESPAFLLALIMIEPTWQGLWVAVGMFFFCQVTTFFFDS